MPEATLLVIQGPGQGSRIELSTDKLSIGRGVHNDSRILDTEMSRQHADFTFENDRWLIVDKNSSNGTFVNGKQVESSPLKQGDQIQLGRSILLFSSTLPSDSSEAAVQINIVPEDAKSDRSRIVGQVRSE
ncbi:MAG: FHA domain-containing protein, partial [Planctomicrobium sp.]|nr:FHA domain-containing protein [Planctomicrobium sp.]